MIASDASPRAAAAIRLAFGSNNFGRLPGLVLGLLSHRELECRSTRPRRLAQRDLPGLVDATLISRAMTPNNHGPGYVKNSCELG
jgi:hypothetical protein